MKCTVTSFCGRIAGTWHELMLISCMWPVDAFNAVDLYKFEERCDLMQLIHLLQLICINLGKYETNCSA